MVKIAYVIIIKWNFIYCTLIYVPVHKICGDDEKKKSKYNNKNVEVYKWKKGGTTDDEVADDDICCVRCNRLNAYMSTYYVDLLYSFWDINAFI